MNGMERVPIFLAAAVAGAAIGCGGALTADDAGAGTGGGAGSSAGGAGGVTAIYDWPGGSISVVPTSASASKMTVIVEDQASPPALSGMLEFAPTTTWDPSNGAGVVAGYGCTPTLYELELSSCANESHFVGGTHEPGCFFAAFTADGTSGNFIHPSGAACYINAAKATIQLPPAVWGPQPAGSPPPDAAVGTFEFNCEGTDGTHLILGGHFLLPTAAWALGC